MANSRLDQTLNTPALATLLLLDEQIRWMLASGGLDAMTARTAESSATLYAWAEGRAEATPFVADPAHRSNVVVTIDSAAGAMNAGTPAACATEAVRRTTGIVVPEPSTVDRSTSRREVTDDRDGTMKTSS